MVSHRDYMKAIESKIEESKAADRIIEEPWFNIVIKALNEISITCDEL